MTINYQIYDIEVFKEDWFVVVHDVKTETTQVIHNDLKAISELFNREDNKIFVGFNNKHYDDWIILSMLQGASPNVVKHHNDWIIAQNQKPWEFPFVIYQKRPFYSLDLRDDLPINLSLKAIEANMNQDIVETGVNFTIDRKLNADEIQRTIKYCLADVKATRRLFKERQKYLEAKLTVGRLKNFEPRYALNLTNAKLTSAFLEAEQQTYSDEFKYPIVTSLKIMKYQKVLDFFKISKTKKSSAYNNKLEIDIAGVPHVYGWGGLHGAVKNCFIKEDADYKMLMIDVVSYYPSLMIKYEFLSRNVPDKRSFAEVYNQRIQAKNNGQSDVAEALKLVLNTTYGASKNKYNALYDPRQANAICVNGQLLLTDLIEKLEKVKSFELIQSNTDGILIRFKIEDENEIESIIPEWEKRTGMNMERTIVRTIAQKDVNNYVIQKGESYIFEAGKKKIVEADTNSIKTKGGYASLAKGGNFENNSLVVVNKALVNFFIKDIPVEKTINDDNNIFDYQIIAKTGSTYNHTIHLIDGEAIEVQKVNRVYATDNKKFGTLFKVKSAGHKNKIASLPSHCLVDNENKLKINQIDKNFYIQLAKKRLADYVGQKKLRKEDL